MIIVIYRLEKWLFFYELHILVEAALRDVEVLTIIIFSCATIHILYNGSAIK